MPEVTVLLPVKNEAKYLPAAIESIISQSFPDFELIVIDDGSVDGSYETALRFSEIDPRVKTLRNPLHGLSAACNFGIMTTDSRFIARMDADDISLPHRLKLQLSEIRARKLDFIGCQGIKFGMRNGRMRRPYHPSSCRASLLVAPPIIHPSSLGRRHAYSEVLYDESVKFGQDYDFWVRCSISGFSFGNSRRALIRYRTHAQQVSQKHRIERIYYAERSQSTYWAHIFGNRCDYEGALAFLRGQADTSSSINELIECLRASSRSERGVLLPVIWQRLVDLQEDIRDARLLFRRILAQIGTGTPVKERFRATSAFSALSMVRSRVTRG